MCPHGNPIVREMAGIQTRKRFLEAKEISNNFQDILDLVVHLPKENKLHIHIFQMLDMVGKKL